MRYADFTPNLRPGLRREPTTEFTNQTQQLNSKARLAISRIALEQKVEGSNPSTRATVHPGHPIRLTSVEAAAALMRIPAIARLKAFGFTFPVVLATAIVTVTGLHFYGLSEAPPGLYVDEASMGYARVVHLA